MRLTRIPESIVEEHEEIFGELRRFARRDDRVGGAIRELLLALEPHFETEEELAMPLLGALAPLSSGKVDGPNLDEVLSLQSELVKALPSMLAEHEKILHLIAGAKREAAKEDQEKEIIDSLRALEHHAKIEEEVLYPAATLTGAVARALRSEVRA